MSVDVSPSLVGDPSLSSSDADLFLGALPLLTVVSDQRVPSPDESHSDSVASLSLDSVFLDDSDGSWLSPFVFPASDLSESLVDDSVSSSVLKVSLSVSNPGDSSSFDVSDISFFEDYSSTSVFTG